MVEKSKIIFFMINFDCSLESNGQCSDIRFGVWVVEVINFMCYIDFFQVGVGVIVFECCL